MENYKELIEKEAEKYAESFRYINMENISWFQQKKNEFSFGINSELNKRIIEIEKRKYAVEILTDLEAKFKWVNIDAYNDVHTKLEYLEQEIANLEKEIK